MADDGCYNGLIMRSSARPLVKSLSIVYLLSFAVALDGLLLIASTLDEAMTIHAYHFRLATHPSGLLIGFPLIAGLTLLYIAVYLRKRKRTAWLAALVVFTVVLLLHLWRLIIGHQTTAMQLTGFTRGVLLPLAIIGGLWAKASQFTVKSDIRSFRTSALISIEVLGIAFLYGIIGFSLLDERDFHQEISLSEAAHRTIDQFDLTTTHALVPHSRRAEVFQLSLSIISIGAVAYSLASLFQPLKAHLKNQAPRRQKTRELLTAYPASSEDFFKLWPQDKLYFFNHQASAGLAYAVRDGIALVVGDPFGNPSHFDDVLSDFDDFCYVNDWLPAYIHTEPSNNELYHSHGFSLQKIGEEALIDIGAFTKEVVGSKYFRQVRNKFTKQGYTSELLQPPHSQQLLSRLHNVSHDWLQRPGRAERRFMMGYFSTAYLQQCRLLILRDSHGEIQAFLNQIPTFDWREASFDILRHTTNAPGNSNDFLLMEFIKLLAADGVERLNLGLCPLAGLDNRDSSRSVVDNALYFVYANGDRFYSFSGLRRFKAKYRPVWSDRYIAYRGGIRGFTKVVTNLHRSMRLH